MNMETTTNCSRVSDLHVVLSEDIPVDSSLSPITKKRKLTLEEVPSKPKKGRKMDRILSFWDNYFIYDKVSCTIDASDVFNTFTSSPLYEGEDILIFMSLSGRVPGLYSAINKRKKIRRYFAKKVESSGMFPSSIPVLDDPMPCCSKTTFRSSITITTPTIPDNDIPASTIIPPPSHGKGPNRYWKLGVRSTRERLLKFWNQYYEFDSGDTLTTAHDAYLTFINSSYFLNDSLDDFIEISFTIPELGAHCPHPFRITTYRVNLIKKACPLPIINEALQITSATSFTTPISTSEIHNFFEATSSSSTTSFTNTGSHMAPQLNDKDHVQKFWKDNFVIPDVWEPGTNYISTHEAYSQYVAQAPHTIDSTIFHSISAKLGIPKSSKYSTVRKYCAIPSKQTPQFNSFRETIHSY